MPIKGLLESKGRLPRLGVIRLGIKERKNDKEYPREVEYFVVPTNLKPLLGERPTKISVLFPSDDPQRVLVADYIRYSGKLLTLKCDGERFTEIPKQGGEIVGDCKKPDGKPCQCGAKAVGRLNVIILDAPLGVWQIVVGGEGRIADLLTELEVYRRALGRLTDIVFSVERVPAEVQVRREDGTRLPKTGWPVHVRCEFTAAQAAALRGVPIPGLSPALPAPPLVEAADEAVREEPHEEEWDISMCFRVAGHAGFQPAEYETYLLACYKVKSGDLPNEAIGKEIEFWRKAQDSPLALATAKSVVVAVLKRVGTQPRML